MIITISMMAVAFIPSGTAFGETLELSGSGTAGDPYLVSSADDLRTVSDLHYLHDGAYYKQTKDIVFNDDLIDDIVTINVSLDSFVVTINVIPNVSGGIKEGFACISLNDSVISMDWDGAFRAFFSINDIMENNSVIAAGSIDGKEFAIAMNFSDVGTGMSLSAPFKGNFKPIGSPEEPFRGSYDGGGHSIKGMKVVSTGNGDVRAGMFGSAESATLFGINIADGNGSYIIGVSFKPNDYSFDSSSAAGGIVGTANEITMIACSVDCTVSMIELLSYDDVYAQNNWSGVRNVTLFLAVGGLMGEGSGIIEDCMTAGTVSAITSSSMTTGIKDGDQTGGYTTLTIFINMGGVIGTANDIIITRTGNTANIYLNSDLEARLLFGTDADQRTEIGYLIFSKQGGIAGESGIGKITDTYNSGDMTASMRFYSDYYYADKIQFYSDAGGCVGYGQAEISRFYNAGKIRSNVIDERSFCLSSAGVAHMNSKDISDCYILDAAVPSGGYTTANKAMLINRSEMAVQGTFTGWDFDHIWKMNESHPEICVRYDAKIKDTSGTFDGTERYSLDRDYNFDNYGTAFVQIGKDGFIMTLNEGYERSDVTLYMMMDEEKVILEKNGNNNYMLPLSFFLQAHPEDAEISSMDLYIDGLGIFASIDGGTGGVIDDTDDIGVVDIIDILSGGRGMTVPMIICMPIIILAILTMYNAMNTGSILSASAEKKREIERGEENEHTG
jgi:hypothetical protein